MFQRPFGRTGLNVSALGLGAAQIGSDSLADQDVTLFLNQVLDSGVNLIDTARGYGQSERRIGESISHRRQEFILSSKIGYSVEGYQDWTPEILMAGVDRALGLLKTDYLDIVHLHSCPLETLQQEGFLEAFQQCKDSGKVRFIAYSGENEILSWAVSSGIFDSFQTSVNPFDQWSAHKVLRDDMTQGVLAKRSLSNFCWSYAERPVGVYGETYWERLQEMNLPDFGLPWDAISLRFSAFTPGVSCALTGTKSFAHFEKNVEAIQQGPLPAEIVDALHNAFLSHLGEWSGEV